MKSLAVKLKIAIHFKDRIAILLLSALIPSPGKEQGQGCREPGVKPYDLVVFDEAHKLSADREPNLRIRRTDRYKIAELFAGIRTNDPKWALPWSAFHLLLLTATPHMGKDNPYYYLLGVFKPDTFSTKDAFDNFPPELRSNHFIRRTKEEMVRFDGSRIYPTRNSDTFSYELSKGNVSEQRLYDETTNYLKNYYNLARDLNRSAVRLAMSVFQRRLASSTYALLKSFERRLSKIDEFIDEIESGRISIEQLLAKQKKLDNEDYDPFDVKTGDEEERVGEKEENEIVQETTLAAIIWRRYHDTQRRA